MTLNHARRLVQDITYWPVASTNKYGERVAAAPVLLRGRWEERQQQMVRPSGEEFISKATVYLTADVAIGGYLAEGDHTGTSDPLLAGAWQIQQFHKIPDLRNSSWERRAYT